MRFIHCADLHLDSGMESGLPPERAKRRRDELLTAFSAVAGLASELEVTAVIIAGDLFDRKNVSVRARRAFLDTVARTDEVDFLLLRGNHDSDVLSGCELPSNLHLFGDGAAFTYGNVNISGTEAPRADGLTVKPEMINIAVLHGEDKKDFELSELAKLGIDYLALGHYHTFTDGPLGDRGRWCYSGCIAGRGFDECGEKGFVLAETEGSSLSYRFVPLPGRQVVALDVDLTDAVTLSDQRTAICAALNGVDRDFMVRLNAVGSFEPGREKYYSNVIDELSPEFFYLELKDRSVMRIDPSDYAGDVSLKGEFIRLAAETVADPDERSRVISFGLRALRGEELT